MKKYIKSFLTNESDYCDVFNLDGIFLVDIPKKHEEDYQGVIHCVGTFLTDAIDDDCCESKESVTDWFEGQEIDCLPLKFFIDNRELAMNKSEDDVSLSRIINFLKESKGESGWSCVDILSEADDFDAEFNEFDFL